jgi:hypothetical protein
VSPEHSYPLLKIGRPCKLMFLILVPCSQVFQLFFGAQDRAPAQSSGGE